jgi:hypothetical protein
MTQEEYDSLKIGDVVALPKQDLKVTICKEFFKRKNDGFARQPNPIWGYWEGYTHPVHARASNCVIVSRKKPFTDEEMEEIFI